MPATAARRAADEARAALAARIAALPDDLLLESHRRLDAQDWAALPESERLVLAMLFDEAVERFDLLAIVDRFTPEQWRSHGPHGVLVAALAARTG